MLLSFNAALYYNTGSYGTPVWTLVKDVKDVTLDLDSTEADVTTRANGGWKATAQALHDASIDFDLIWDPADAFFTAALTAHLARTTMELLVLDEVIATVGAQGLRAICCLPKFSREEQIDDVLRAKVSAKPTYAANPPVWYVVPAP